MKTLIYACLIGLVLISTPAFAQKQQTPNNQLNKALQQKTQQILKVNLNKASAEELSNQLTGIGLSKAQAIVTYRKANGPFKTVGDLVKVKGIGPATIEKNLTKLSI